MKKSTSVPVRKKRKSGIPTGNSGEYFVMGELLRRGYDAQLADRNTKGYDLLVGRSEDKVLRKVQVKTVRVPPWYVNVASFEGDLRDQVTIYVLLGKEDGQKPVRYFIARNRELAKYVHKPPKWTANAFMLLKSVEPYEDRWDVL
ncbi:hypothetical protein [Pseudolabrys sp.]|jgi:hypothetical protein|uniref:hypothetical protein n=1 Tax=Pseudolabrys sp. TaxID=1960880 RepID=UPI003D0FDBD1